MERRTVARLLRGLRRGKGWSQARLGALLGISQSEMSRWERRELDSCTVAELDSWAQALGADLVLDLRVRGVRPMTDAKHAELQTLVVKRLRGAGWLVDTEVSFNRYGDRGIVDVLAYHPGRRFLLVIEIKTRLEDSQDLLGRLDIKRRIGPILAKERGWSPAAIVPTIIFQESRTTRRRLASVDALFARFSLRGKPALTWLRRPTSPAPPGILLLMATAQAGFPRG